MKLKLSIFASITAIIASNAGAIEIYNKAGNKIDLHTNINGVYYIFNRYNKNNDRSSVNYSIRGETKINDKITGFGVWNHFLKINNFEKEISTNASNYLSFVGLKIDNIGSIDYGRNYSILYDIDAWTNVMHEFTTDDNIIIDNFTNNQNSSLLTYRNYNFFGKNKNINFALQYNRKNSDNKTSKYDYIYKTKELNDNNYGVSVIYHLSNEISAGAAYVNSNPNKFLAYYDNNILPSALHNKSKRAEVYSAGIKYKINNLYIAALYKENHNMIPYNILSKKINGFVKKISNIELVTQYKFDFGLKSSLGYIQSQINEDNNIKNENIKKYIEIGANYKFNKNILTFIDYRINLLSKSNKKPYISSSDIIKLGMTYTF